jgi:hypothetical protein
MLRPQRLLLAATLGAWVLMVLACGGAVNEPVRPADEPAKTEKGAGGKTGSPPIALTGGKASLRAGATLKAGERVTSDNGQFTLYMQTDGTVALYAGAEPHWVDIWWKHAGGANPCLDMQAVDGNLVLVGEERGRREPAWDAGVYAAAGAYLVVQDNGDLVVVDAAGKRGLWSSSTAADAGIALKKYEERLAEAKRLATPLKAGPGAYDDLPEPWRGRAAKEWQARVESCKEKVDEAQASLGKAKGAMLEAEKSLADFIKKNGEKPEGAFAQDILRNRTAKATKAKAAVPQAEAALDAAKAKLAEVMKNDPPYLPKELAGSKTIGDVEGRVAEITARERAAVAAAEAERKAKEREKSQSGVLRKGEQGYIEVEGEDVVWVAISEKAFDELNSFSSAKNAAAIMQMIQQGRVLVCAKGTKVSVIDPGFFSTTVRMLNGTHAGKEGIVPNEFLHK